MSVRNEKGFALVESVSGLMFALVFVGGGLSLSYAFVANLWIRHAAYEASICLSTSQPRFQCERKLRSSISDVLKVGSVIFVRLTRTPNLVHTSVFWKIPGGFEFTVENSQSLPLLGGKRSLF
ncbi:MAG: hypothetical protein EOP05_07495 [Proteobacteria bacterium]|nr:MAG: hypothetical protein EOP05_07495 [Pseudomonadota bacterium]